MELIHAKLARCSSTEVLKYTRRINVKMKENYVIQILVIYSPANSVGTTGVLKLVCQDRPLKLDVILN